MEKKFFFRSFARYVRTDSDIVSEVVMCKSISLFMYNNKSGDVYLEIFGFFLLNQSGESLGFQIC